MAVSPTKGKNDASNNQQNSSSIQKTNTVPGASAMNAGSTIHTNTINMTPTPTITESSVLAPTSNMSSAYAHAPAPTVVPVPRPCQDLSQDGIPWYSRTPPPLPQSETTVDESHIPWYSRSPPPTSQNHSTLNVSVADREYAARDYMGADTKVPWYSRGPKQDGQGCDGSIRNYAASNDDENKKKGVGSMFGASVLGGVAGVVALGPLAGVAAAGGLAYASARKDGPVGDIVRGAGSLVASAINGAASLRKDASEDRRGN